MVWIIRIFATLSLVLIGGLAVLLVVLTQQRVLTSAEAHADPTVPPTQVRPSATPRPPANATRWFPGSIVLPSATPSPAVVAITTVTPNVTAGPSITPSPTIVPQSYTASFVPGESAFMHNVTVALDANNGALRRIVVPPGETFSFVKSLGARPHTLPWRNVYVSNSAGGGAMDSPVFSASNHTPRAAGMQPNAVFFNTGGSAPMRAAQEDIAKQLPIGTPRPRPTLSIELPAQPVESDPAMVDEIAAPSSTPLPPTSEPTAEPTVEPTPTPTSTPAPVPVLGGGVCDLASRYVVAARPFLPDTAFKYKPHPNGLRGVAYRDAVSIWFDGLPTDLDLQITNLTDRWLVFDVQVERGVVTITATLQGAP